MGPSIYDAHKVFALFDPITILYLCPLQFEYFMPPSVRTADVIYGCPYWQLEDYKTLKCSGILRTLYEIDRRTRPRYLNINCTISISGFGRAIKGKAVTSELRRYRFSGSLLLEYKVL